MVELKCEKCGGTNLKKTKVRRLSGCLAAIGYTLWVPGAIGLLVAVLLSLVVVGATGKGAADLETQTKAEVVQQLRQIEGVPDTLIAGFEDSGNIPQAQLEALDVDARERVKEALLGYEMSRAAGAAGTAIGAGLSGFGVAILYVFSIPCLIIGLLLTLKKKVWRCSECGVAFDRT